MGQLCSAGSSLLTSGLKLSLQNQHIFVLFFFVFVFFNVYFVEENVKQIVSQEYSAVQWCAGKCLTTGSPGIKKAPLVATTDSLGINIPTMANFQLFITEH